MIRLCCKHALKAKVKAILLSFRGTCGESNDIDCDSFAIFPHACLPMMAREHKVQASRWSNSVKYETAQCQMEINTS